MTFPKVPAALFPGKPDICTWGSGKGLFSQVGLSRLLNLPLLKLQQELIFTFREARSKSHGLTEEARV